MDSVTNRLNFILCIMTLATGLGAGVILQVLQPIGLLWLLSITTLWLAALLEFILLTVVVWAFIGQLYLFVAQVVESWRERQRIKKLNLSFEELKNKK